MPANRAVYLIFALGFLPSVCLAQTAPIQFQSMEGSLVPLNSKEGRSLLQESKAQESFWSLSQFYSAQPDLASCSVASCTMVLNALPLKRPVSKPHGPYKLFTPDNFFTREVEAVVPRSTVLHSGMDLNQLARSLKSYPIEVQCIFASDSTITQFRQTLSKALLLPDSHILVNFDRKKIGQPGGGHISPIGAYNAEKDLVLILDTANYKFPWVWVKIERLWDAMAGAVDPSSNRSRGYVVVSSSPAK
jgi:hypothetical protein